MMECHGKGMNAARQISRRFGRATGARIRSASSDCIVRVASFGPDPLIQMPESTSRLIYKPLPSDDAKKRKPDITLAHALLDSWEPKVPLQEGLAKTIVYFREKFG